MYLFEGIEVGQDDRNHLVPSELIRLDLIFRKDVRKTRYRLETR